MSEPRIINFYSVSDQYGEFSNFAAYPIVITRKRWPTSEHYFQGRKFENPAIGKRSERPRHP